MVKGGLRATKVSDGKVKFTGNVGTRLANALGSAATQKLRELIKTGKPLNATALKALLGHRNARIADQLVDFTKTRAGSKGTQLRVSATQKVDYKGAIGNPFVNKSSKFIKIENVTTAQGTQKTSDMIALLADKLGVPKDELAKKPVEIRVAENAADNKEAKMGKAMGNFMVRGSFEPATRIITVNKQFLNDVLKNGGKEAGSILVHEMGHYLVDLKKDTTQRFLKMRFDKRTYEVEMIAEELAVETLAQSLSDARNRLGYEALISHYTDSLSKTMKIPLKDAIRKIIDTGFRQNQTDAERNEVLAHLSVARRLSSSNHSFADVAEALKKRDEVLDAALDVYEERGFQVNREHKSKDAKDYRSIDNVQSKQDKALNQRWAALQKATPLAALGVEELGGLPPIQDKLQGLEAKEMMIRATMGQMPAGAIAHSNLPAEVKTAVMEQFLFAGAMNATKGVPLNNVENAVRLALGSKLGFSEVISATVPKENIEKIIQKVASREVRQKMDALTGETAYLPETMIISPAMFAGAIMQVSGKDLGTSKMAETLANADLLHAARFGDEAAMTELKQKYPEGHAALTKALTPEMLEQGKMLHSLMQDEQMRKQMLEYTMPRIIMMARSNAAHPRKYNMAKLNNEIRFNLMHTADAIRVTGNPEAGRIMQQLLQGMLQSYVDKMGAVNDKKLPEATNWSSKAQSPVKQEAKPTAAITPQPAAPVSSSKPAEPKVSATKTESPAFKVEQKHKDFITNAVMRQQMGNSLEGLKSSQPDVYKEMEKQGYIENGKVTGKGHSLLINKK